MSSESRQSASAGPPVLLIGGSGQLGTALRDVLVAPIVAPSHTEFDLVNDDVGSLLDALRSRVVINCAAFHNVDRCEREPANAFDANAIAVERLAGECAKRDVTFVTISTDYVFSGEATLPYVESDIPGPSTVYGTSKLAGEYLARRQGRKSIVIRTSGVFGTIGSSSKGYTLIDRVLQQAERGEKTRMVSNMTFSPSFAPHVARAIGDLIECNAFGVHHVTNAGSCTWYEFVRAAFDKAGLSDAPLDAIDYASLGNATPRPMHSSLNNTTFDRLHIRRLPSWDDALDEFLLTRAQRLINTRTD